MYILVGELEFNERHYHSCGGPQSFLFVKTQHTLVAGPDPKIDCLYQYAMYNMNDPNQAHLGNLFHTQHNLSVTEFLQRFVDDDEQIGRGIIKSFANCKVRLKGMTEWIERSSLK